MLSLYLFITTEFISSSSLIGVVGMCVSHSLLIERTRVFGWDWIGMDGLDGLDGLDLGVGGVSGFSGIGGVVCVVSEIFENGFGGFGELCWVGFERWVW